MKTRSTLVAAAVFGFLWVGRTPALMARINDSTAQTSEGVNRVVASPADGFSVSFSDDSVKIAARTGTVRPWHLDLRTVGIGRGDRSTFLSPARVERDEARATYRRGTLTEWYVNGPKGLEQGFTLQRPPSSGSRRKPLTIDVAFETDLRAARAVTGDAVLFREASGVEVVRYAGLEVHDAKGQSVPSRLALEPGLLRIFIDDVGAQYPLVVDPLISTPAWIADGDQTSAQFGYSVAVVGDVNGDGHPDVVVGAPLEDSGAGAEGRASLYLGTASGLELSPAWSFATGQAGSRTGIAVAAAGDVNGDGYADVLVGADLFDDAYVDGGAAFLFLGSPTGLSASPDWAATGPLPGGRFGASLASAGDVNADGFFDVVIGAPDYFSDHAGLAVVYLGGPSGLSAPAAATLHVEPGLARFGASVSSAGDVNGDGFDDLIIGAPDYSGSYQGFEGKAFLFLGSATGIAPTASWSFLGRTRGERFGASVSSAGDVNGDGFGDVVVGAPSFSIGASERGEAYAFLGSAAALPASPSWAVQGTQGGSRLGWSVATAGDVNGDGFDDVAIGAPQHDGQEIDAGRVRVYQGSASGLRTAVDWSADGDLEGASFGWALGSGDLNGDGRGDLLVGAPFRRGPLTDQGRAFLFLGAANSPPRANAGPDDRYECTSPSGAVVTLDGSASTDPDSTPGTNDDIVLFEWFEGYAAPSQRRLGTGKVFGTTLSIGSHLLTLRVTDSAGQTDLDDVTATVVDTRPPTISINLAPSSLWPPNHRMAAVTARVDAFDACSTPTVRLVAVTSSEPDDEPGGGDGSTVNDIQDADLGAPDFSFALRAERSGDGTGRTYLAAYEAADPSGNTARASASTVVPHDRAGVTEPLQLTVGQDVAGLVVRWSEVPGASYYNVIRGRLGELRVNGSAIDLGTVRCVAAATVVTSTEGFEDATLPQSGEGFFYLVEYFDGASSAYGTESAPKPEVPASGACPP